MNFLRDPVFEKLGAVHDAETFLEFLKALLDDLPCPDEMAKKSNTVLYLSGVGGWMNQDLWSFFEASIACGRDNNIGEQSLSSAEAWKAAAEILYGGKIYE